jgi:hypothetical protein
LLYFVQFDRSKAAYRDKKVVGDVTFSCAASQGKRKYFNSATC